MSNKQQPQRLDVINEQGSLSGFTGLKKFWPLKPYLFLTILGILLTIPVGALDAAVASFLKPFMDNVMVDKDTEFAYKYLLSLLDLPLFKVFVSIPLTL